MSRSKRYFLRSPENRSAEPTVVEISQNADGSFALKRGDTVFSAQLLSHHDGRVAFQLGHDNVNASVYAQGERVEVKTNAGTHAFTLHDERTEQLQAAMGAHGVEGKQAVVSPMPGKVVKLLVKLGDEVALGQGLVVVEAMKMENELKSPKAGTVTAVTVAEGAVVENGTVLLSVE
jgi:biotin carboxyl carrier protein